MKTNHENLNTLLASLGSRGLARADKALVTKVALSLWYTSEVPNLGAVSSNFRRDAGYVVDRLSRSHLLTKERKSQLHEAVAPFKQSKTRTVTKGEDPLQRVGGLQRTLLGSGLICCRFKLDTMLRLSNKNDL